MKAYMGKLLRVDLTKRKATEVPLREDYARDYIGGTGLGVRLAYDEVAPETDPLSPEAKIFFMTGPVTGTPLGTTGRYQVVFKSPLTGILCDSSSSGFWGVELKNAGYDGLIVEGASDTPVYVSINDGKVEFRDARKHWGKDAISVQDDLRAEVGDPKARVATIGQAGENKVLFSCIVNDDGRVPGRGGNGAVMGSKNLKAIVVRGTGKVELADPEGFKKIALEINKKNATVPFLADLRKNGTSTVLDASWPISDIPVKNWSVGSSEAACTPLGGEKQYELSSGSHASCYRCPISCSSKI
ncbi:MAG: aldehyde ferredoxin oxidoreductase N-terminal domain-containing protein, partial [Sedimentisphaerales bacterium]|nr:aldehyde ferredoxin oxidoreductase N-terminal domain-containing protein [Sedimentisphaerales bacterium]